jgi:hypothetical protein
MLFPSTLFMTTFMNQGLVAQSTGTQMCATFTTRIKVGFAPPMTDHVLGGLDWHMPATIVRRGSCQC